MMTLQIPKAQRQFRLPRGKLCVGIITVACVLVGGAFLAPMLTSSPQDVDHACCAHAQPWPMRQSLQLGSRQKTAVRHIRPIRWRPPGCKAAHMPSVLVLTLSQGERGWCNLDGNERRNLQSFFTMVGGLDYAQELVSFGFLTSDVDYFQEVR